VNPKRPLVGPDDPRHGKPTTYVNHHCRCAQCRHGWAKACYVRAHSTPERIERERLRQIAYRARMREAKAAG